MSHGHHHNHAGLHHGGHHHWHRPHRHHGSLKVPHIHEPSLAKLLSGMEAACRVDHLKGGTKDPHKLQGHCAHAVNDGMNAAGFHVGMVDADKLKPILEKHGFIKQPFVDVSRNTSSLKAGDVIFITPPPGTHQSHGDHKTHGHVAVWDGKHFISDGIQKNAQVYSDVPFDAKHVTLMRNPALSAQADQILGVTPPQYFVGKGKGYHHPIKPEAVIPPVEQPVAATTLPDPTMVAQTSPDTPTPQIKIAPPQEGGRGLFKHGGILGLGIGGSPNLSAPTAP